MAARKYEIYLGVLNIFCEWAQRKSEIFFQHEKRNFVFPNGHQCCVYYINTNEILNLSPGQTIEQSWILHPTLLEVNVEIVAKHCPTLLDETSYRVLNLKTWSSDTETKSACNVYGTGAVWGCKWRLQARKRNGQENEQKTVCYVSYEQDTPAFKEIMRINPE